LFVLLLMDIALFVLLLMDIALFVLFLTISLEMPVPSQGHYGFHSFPVVD
jgi:hypothetical protein